MPAVARDGRATASNTATTLTVSFDSGSATAGNLLVAFAYTAGYTVNYPLTTPTGWTEVLRAESQSNRQVAWYVKEAAGGETGVTLTRSVPASPSNTRWDGHVFEVSGSDAAAIVLTPSDLLATATHADSTVESLASAAIDPTSSDECLFLAGFAVNTGISGPAGTNSFVVDSTVPSSGGRSFVLSRAITNPGSTSTTGSWTNGNSASSIILAIPATSGAAGAPTANAGADQTPTRSVTVTLDGSATTDATSYQWTQSAGPTVSITNSTQAQASVTLTQAGSYAFRLTASNANGSDTDDVLVTITADSGGTGVVQVWNGTAWE